MWTKDNIKMKELVDKTNSPYAAVMYVASKARKLKSDSHHVINESIALEWAISGEPPKNLDKRIQTMVERDEVHEKDKLQSVLDTIEDETIRIAVLNSYRASSRSKRLIYDYNGIEDKNMKSRVRILTKMAYIL